MSTKTGVEWDFGTAYDFFISLSVLHEPEHFGLRGSWAAGVRSRLPTTERDLLQRVVEMIWPLPWVYQLPTPKDVDTALAALRQLPAEERLLALIPVAPTSVQELWRSVAERGSWGEADLKVMTDELLAAGWKSHSSAILRKTATDFLDLVTDPRGAGEGLLAALECYQVEFFAEEEARIRPALERALDRAKDLARTLPREALLEELSQGVRMAEKWQDRTLILAPSFWATPLVLLADFSPARTLFLFGARPTDVSLIPGELVPDALHQALKALADPTRLRILRYLTDEPSTPAELARRLRLRSPTVIHHLDALRLARLVIVTLDAEGKRYAIRPDAVTAVCEMLQGFLAGREEQ